MSTWSEAGQFLLTAGGTAVMLRVAGFRFRPKTGSPKPICGCKHDLALHDLRTGECHDQMEIPSHWDGYGIARKWRYERCPCRQYTGPMPLEMEFRPPPLMPRPTTEEDQGKT